MAKKLLVVFLALMLVVTIAYASKNRQLVDKDPVIVKKSHVISKSYLLQNNGDPVIWEDDFEGMDPHWVAAAGWYYEDYLGGYKLQETSSWHYVDSKANSGTYSWNATADIMQARDFLISPAVTLPTELESEGLVMPLKGVKADYMMYVDTPGGNGDDTQGEQWWHTVGKSEEVWEFSADNPGAGASCWHLDPTHTSTEGNGRHAIITPEIDLSNVTGTVTLSFMHAYLTELAWDYLSVDVSTDDFMSYQSVAHYGELGEEAWNAQTADLSAYAGEKIKIRFVMILDDLTIQGGAFWSIDEIKVSDENGRDLFYDDGGESGTSDMTQFGFAGCARFAGSFATDEIPWQAHGIFELDGFQDIYRPGDDFRFAFLWISNGDDVQGTGLFVDDFVLYGVGKPAIDVAVLGANTLSAALGVEFNPTVYFMNTGLEALSGGFLWTGEITDEGGKKMTTLYAQQTINVAPDSVFTMKSARGWTPEMPGNYNLKVIASIQNDGDATNDTLETAIWVPGGPWTQVLWRQDFDSDPTAATFEDLGFTVENGGGDAYGNNVNTWEYNPGFIYGAGPTISAFWGILDPGVNTTDSSEVLDEGLITPPIDISMLGMNNTVHLHWYCYYRPGYPGYADFGVATSELTLSASLDGENWVEFFYWVDDDSLPGNGPRLPQTYYEDRVLGTYDFLDMDMSAVLADRQPGQDQLWIKFHLACENSWFVAWNVDELTVYAGTAAPVIKEVADVPEDNGKQVRVVWKAYQPDLKIWDDAGNGWPVTHYTVWRLDPEGDKVPDFLCSVPAHSFMMYSKVVSTLVDEKEYHFIVSAQTANPMVFQNSKPMPGSSTDDLAPYSPTNLDANVVNHDITLTWEASQSEDVAKYYVYRKGEKIVETTDLTYTDSQLDGSYTYYVTALDYAGNESEKSNEKTVDLTTSVDNFLNAVPTEFALYQNYPNPFNPATTIHYSIPKVTHVTIKVYNASGQEIATLVNNQVPVGNYKLEWNAAGVSSGIYFYTIKAGDFSQTMKMILMK